ncbi:hypothetical protein T07_870 [Trichinella nelsoni]|uniref:Uncharacterized protein n=1 Tax=Trichinella nelsoni TaxID=6336 RepID=A0A0V0S225_9BILA|nr:hypothetical protein T07_870 [Trichinella nelsoni]
MKDEIFEKTLFLQKWTIWASVDEQRFVAYNKPIAVIPICVVVEIIRKKVGSLLVYEDRENGNCEVINSTTAEQLVLKMSN